MSVIRTMDLGSAIRERRKRAGIPIKEAARQAHISMSYWSLVENEKRNPTLSVLQAMAAALDVPLSHLIRRAEEIERNAWPIPKEEK